MKKSILFSLLFFPLILTSCSCSFIDSNKDDKTPTVPSKPGSEGEGSLDNPVSKYDPLKPSNISRATPNEDESSYRIINSKDLRFTYLDVAESENSGMVPSIGSPNILLVPVEFSDLKRTQFEWSEEDLNILNGAFNGTKSDCTNDYKESVRSFYRKSSYGKLDLNFILADPFTPEITSNTFVSYENDDEIEGKGTKAILDDLKLHGTIDNKKIDFSDKKFDLNNDGFFDGIWLIYNDKRQEPKYKDRYWPYCFWYEGEQKVTGDELLLSCYANCSFAFLFEGTDTGLDYHTITHETGHMMGLDDYYSYDLNGRKPAALGGLDMMDLNIGDHNAFSKTALGWTNPIIPKKDGEFLLRPFEATGDCMILANSFNDSAFSEYIMLEYYTPTGLNELDATISYPERPKYFNVPGLRAYHVDARLLKVSLDYRTGAIYPDKFLSETEEVLPYLSPSNPTCAIVASSNTRSRSVGERGADNSKDLIAAIDANNRPIYNKRFTDNGSLFKEGKKFSPWEYQKYFQGNIFGCNFNDGSEVNFTFKVTEMDNKGIKVQVTL